MNFFKRRRTELGRTQLDISNALGMTASAVWSWEKEENAPRLSLVPKLAQLYEVPESRIISEIVKLSARVKERSAAAVK